MNHRLACLVAAGLALAADPHADVSASVYHPTPTVEILVGGTAQRQYPHQGRWYSRGRSRAASTRFGCGTPTASVSPWLSRLMA